MNNADYLAVYTTIDQRDAARQIARTVVERRLAACVHISEIESFYSWNQAIQNDVEFRITFKTTASNFGALKQAIHELHSYDVPAIYAIQLDNIDEHYAAWIKANVE